MGSSDLNLKKSWHPHKAHNIAATAKAEAEAIAERKKAAARAAEIRAEQKEDEIRRMMEASGKTTGPRIDRNLSWMYSGPGDGQGGDSAESEAFLLGTRRLDKLLQENEVKKLQKQAAQENTPLAPSGVSARDTAAKLAADPLLAIKKQEQDAYEAMLNDPIKRRQLLASMGIEDPRADKSQSKEERRHKHRHHHRRHRRRDDDSDGERRSRKRDRSDSRDRSRSRRRHDSEDRDRQRRRRDSPAKRRSHSDTESEREYRDKRSDRRKEESQSRSRSPPRRRRSDSRDRYESRRDRYKDDYRNRNGTSSQRRRDYNDDTPRNNGGRDRGSNAAPPKERDEDERARKLAAMQEAASTLDNDRERRLAAIQEAENAADEADDKARQQAKRFGGDRHFANSMRRQGGAGNLASRFSGGKQGLRRDND